jgi:hypothetical protein
MDAAEIDVGTAVVSMAGFLYDKKWVLAHPEGFCLRRRDHPDLALVIQEIEEAPTYGEGKLSLCLPRGGSITLPLAGLPNGRVREVRIGDRTAQGVEQESPEAGRFSEHFGPGVKLVRLSNHEPQAGVRAVSAGLLRELNAQLEKMGEEPASADLFLANLVLGGADPGFVLDRSLELLGMQVLLEDGRPCPWEGDPDSPVGRALAHRRIGGRIHFGTSFRFSAGSDGMILGVGDRLNPRRMGTALEFDPPPSA